MKVSLEEAQNIIIMGSSEGICTDCGNGQSGVEPDARGYQCESCGEHSVMGLEEAIFDGHIQIGGESTEDY